MKGTGCAVTCEAGRDGTEGGYSPLHTLPWSWKRVAGKPHATATLPPGNKTGIHYR